MSPDDQLFQRFGKAFPRGTVLFREGEPGQDMFVVHRGRVRITKRAANAETVLGTLGPGEFFGEMSVLSGNPRSATAACEDDCELLVVDARTFEAMLRGHGEIALRMIRMLADRLHHANQQIETLMLPDAASRLVHWLATAAERDARAGGARPRVVPVAEITTSTGLDAKQVTGLLEKIGRTGVVALSPGGVAVPDAARLRQFLDFLKMKAQFGEMA